MKLLGLLGVLLLAMLLPTGHRSRRRSRAQPLRPRVAPVQIIRSPWAAQAPKTVRRVPAQR